MSSTYTSSLRLEIQAEAENNNDWGDRANSVFQQLEQAVAGYTSIALTGATVTLTALNATTDQSRPAFLELVGTLTSNIGIIIPSVTKGYVVRNNTSGSFTVTMKCTAGSGLVLPQGGFCPVVCDGASVHQAVSRLATLEVSGSVSMGSNLTLAGALNVGGAVSLNSTLVVEGAISLLGATVITGATSLGSTLTVAGATSVASTLTAAGAVSAASLKVTDVSLTRQNLGFTFPLVNQAYNILSTASTTNAGIPSDNTIPQSSEGATLIQTSIKPTAPSSLLHIRAGGVFAANPASSDMTLAVFTNQSANAVGASGQHFSVAQVFEYVQVEAFISANVSTSIDVSVRFGNAQGSGTSITCNGTNIAQYYGGSANFVLSVLEILRP